MQIFYGERANIVNGELTEPTTPKKAIAVLIGVCVLAPNSEK